VAASKNVPCQGFGSATDLKEITVFGMAGETWKISLPICQLCAFVDRE
jgi:hypothetical protein